MGVVLAGGPLFSEPIRLSSSVYETSHSHVVKVAENDVWLDTGDLVITRGMDDIIRLSLLRQDVDGGLLAFSLAGMTARLEISRTAYYGFTPEAGDVITADLAIETPESDGLVYWEVPDTAFDDTGLGEYQATIICTNDSRDYVFALFRFEVTDILH